MFKEVYAFELYKSVFEGINAAEGQMSSRTDIMLLLIQFLGRIITNTNKLQ